MHATARILLASLFTLGLTAPAVAGDDAGMPPELTREIRDQGAAALEQMSVEGTRLDGRDRALTTLGAALQGSAPALAGRDPRTGAPCAEATQSADGRSRLLSAPVATPSVRLPRILLR